MKIDNKRNYIVVKVPLFDFPMEEVQELFERIREALPNEYNLIIIPRDVDWCELNKTELYQMRDMLNEVLKNTNE